MEIIVSMVAFFALVVSWFVLPAAPQTAKAAMSTSDAQPIAA
jgi:hypothetical protein